MKNGGAGVAVRHCFLEIDDHPNTKIQDNDYEFQVYVTLKDCIKLLTGFDQAMSEKRIKGRKVLVGGGWGQMTPVIQYKCCGKLQTSILKPCIESLKSAAGLNRQSDQFRGRKIVPITRGDSALPVYLSTTKNQIGIDEAVMMPSPMKFENRREAQIKVMLDR